MATNDQSSQNNCERETPFDDSIRTALRGEMRRTPDVYNAWTRILQRAQTEISQLPPIADGKSDTDNSHVLDLNRSVLPLHYTLLSRPDGSGFDALRPNFGEQIGYYRRLMDMKMWRSVGALGLLSGTL